MPAKRRSKSRSKSKGRKILNPETGRMVLVRGKIGQMLKNGNGSMEREVSEAVETAVEVPLEVAAVATEVVADVASTATSLSPGKMVSSVSSAGATAIAVLGSAAKKVAKLGKGALKVLDPLTKFGAEGLNSGERRVLRALQNKNETRDSITETAQTVSEMTGALAKSVVSVGYEAVSSPFEVYDGIVYGKAKMQGGDKLKGGETHEIDWNKFHSYKNKDYLNTLVSQ
jgi:hypothetical protein